MKKTLVYQTPMLREVPLYEVPWQICLMSMEEYSGKAAVFDDDSD